MFLIFCLYHHVCIWWPLRHWKNRLVYDLQNMSNISWKERNLVGENWKVYDHLFIQYHKYFFLVCKRINSQYENVQIHIYMLHIHTSYLGASWWTITSACCIFILLKNPIHAHRCSWEFYKNFKFNSKEYLDKTLTGVIVHVARMLSFPELVGLDWTRWKARVNGRWDTMVGRIKMRNGGDIYTTSVCRYRGTREGSSCSLTWLSQAYRTSCIAERKMASTWPRVAPTLCLIMCHVPQPSCHITHVRYFKHFVNLKYDKSEKVGCRWTYSRPG